MQEYDFSYVNLDAIERRARQMRAEAVAHAFNTMFSWAKSRFSARPVQRRHAA